MIFERWRVNLFGCPVERKKKEPQLTPGWRGRKALAQFGPGDFPAIADSLPGFSTYANHLKSLDALEAKLEATGFEVLRAHVSLASLRRFCAENGLPMFQQAVGAFFSHSGVVAPRQRVHRSTWLEVGPGYLGRTMD
jgi:hypothetical protein